jgi:Spy/CpxP family protein refolding chaperone
MNRNRVLSTVIGIFMIASTSHAQNAWWTNDALMTRLGLTDQQQSRIESTFQAYRPSLAAATGALDKEEAQLSKLLGADPVDKSAVLLQTNHVIQARGEVERVNAAMTVEMRQQLTSAQWAQLQAPANAPRGGRGAGGRGAAATPVNGADSFAARFAADKPVTLEGRVTEVKLQDPHSYVIVDVVGKDGKTASWSGEMGSWTNLSKQGWTTTSLKPGDKVVIDGSHSLDPNENLVNIRRITRVP